MLLGEVKIRISNPAWQNQAVVLQTLCFAKRLKLLGSKHLAQRVERIDSTINNDMRNVNALR